MGRKRSSPEEAAALRAQGFDFYDWGQGEIRLVTSWDQEGEPLHRVVRRIGRPRERAVFRGHERRTRFDIHRVIRSSVEP